MENARHLTENNLTQSYKDLSVACQSGDGVRLHINLAHREIEQKCICQIQYIQNSLVALFY
jgi:hypothetical protein